MTADPTHEQRFEALDHVASSLSHDGKVEAVARALAARDARIEKLTAEVSELKHWIGARQGERFDA
jgi:hypothetical protein